MQIKMLPVLLCLYEKGIDDQKHFDHYLHIQQGKIH